MQPPQSWLDRLVNALPNTRLFQFVARRVLVPYWAWRTPMPPQPGGPPFSAQPGDNVQRMMNLVMPLKDKSPIGRAMAALAVAQNTDEIFAGLNNVGTVHFARFVLVGDNLCMFSVYDGDFTNYIRDFIATIGSVFDGVVALVEGGEAVIPSEQHVEAFIDWVHAHDLLPGTRFCDRPAAGPASGQPGQRSSDWRRPAAAATGAHSPAACQPQCLARQRLPVLSRVFGGAGAASPRPGLVARRGGLSP